MINYERFNIATFTVYISIIFLALKLVISPNLSGVEDEVSENNTLSYFCDFMIFLCCVLNFRIVHERFRFIFQMFFVIFVSFSLSTLISGGSIFDSLKSLLRMFVPFLFFTVLCSYFYNRKDELIKVSKILLLLIVTLTIIGLAVLPPSVNRWDGDNEGLWWPAYFSGIHTTTYIVISVYFVIFSLYKINYFSKLFAISAFFLCFYSVAFGWGVRTTTLSIIVLILADSYYTFISNNYYRRVYVNAAVFMLFAMYFIFYFDWNSVDAISSGRLSMYEFKFYQLLDNSIVGWIIGNGAGSDIVETDFWWWEAKGAHSDLITFLVEGGLIYLFCFLMILKKLTMIFQNDAGRCIVFALFITSVFSNGFFVRPLALYFVLFSLALLYVRNGNTTLVKD